MNSIIEFLKNNKEWIFDGIGGVIITILIGVLVKEKMNKNILKDKSIQKNINGDNSGNQELLNCNNSQAILVQGDYNVTGITKEEAEAVALKIYKLNSMELSNTAQETAIKRVEEIVNEFFDKLFKEENDLSKFLEPSFQSTFINAQIQYAKSGDKVNKELLIETLNKRVISKEQSLKQKILDETIIIINKITVEQMNFLSLRFILVYIILPIISKQQFKKFLSETVMKFYNINMNSKKFFEYLNYIGCVKELQESKKFNNIEEIVKFNYSGIFSKGFSKEEFEGKTKLSIDQYKGLLQECINDNSKLQFSCLNENELKIKISKLKLWDKEQSILELYRETTKEDSSIKTDMLGMCTEFSKIFDLWNKEYVGLLELTPVGLVIGILNYNRVTGENINIDRFI